jgi:PPOX class probable F420-dependent enzyme
MTAPSVPSTHVDLLDAPVGTLATNGSDGRPQLTAVWFLAVDGLVKISLHEARHKVKNMRANPLVTFFILDTADPARYVEIRGTARIESDPDYEFANQLGAKYGVADLRLFDGDDQRRTIVTVEPAHVVAVNMNAREPE